MRMLPCLWLLLAGSAFAAEAQEAILKLTGGTHLKAVWVKNKKTLQAFDTRTGQVRAVYTATEKEVTWPMIAPDGCVAVSDVEDSLLHLWDPDGLWVGRLLESPVLNGLPSWLSQIKCENFGGSLYTEKDGNVLFFAFNENNQRQQKSVTLKD